MSVPYFSSFLIFIFLLAYGDGWRAVPANHAMYARRSSDVGRQIQELSDDALPKNYLSSIYKFGDCGRGMVRRQFLRSTVNVSFDTYSDTQGNYMYILSDSNTKRYQKQCVVLKTYVPRKYLFWKSRMPLYYCQGTLWILVFDTIHRLAIHEFFAQNKLSIPANMYFEFYHPDLY